MKYNILLDIQHQQMELVEQDEPQPNNRLDETATAIIEGTGVSFVPSAASGPRREVFPTPCKKTQSCYLR